MLNPENDLENGWLITYCELLRETPVTEEKTEMLTIADWSNKLQFFNLELYSVF